MSKPSAEQILNNEKEKAFEIIELATSDLFTLADAFHLIADACEDREVLSRVVPPSDSTDELH